MSAYQAIRAKLMLMDDEMLRRCLHEAQARKFLTQARGNDGQFVVLLTTGIVAIKDEMTERGLLKRDRESMEVAHATA
jgi:4-hydroxyphenylpyruvate dioxygenase-like putative hemolysin